MTTHVRLTPDAHAVYELADGLLLVFKPAGHTEKTHAHPYTQRLRVLRGQLRVEHSSATVTLGASSEPLSLAQEQAHATTALEPTWVIAETISDVGAACLAPTQSER